MAQTTGQEDAAPRDDFVHLHVHTDYSMLDGAGKIKDYIAEAKRLGQSALAITDHGYMFGAYEFYAAATAAGIKPIIGVEAYIRRAPPASTGPACSGGRSPRGATTSRPAAPTRT